VIDAPTVLLAVRQVRQLSTRRLVWDRRIGSWSVAVSVRSCNGAGASHPRRGDPCIALVLRPVLPVLCTPDLATEVHFDPWSPVVVVAGEDAPTYGGGLTDQTTPA
jgi:hypothetical protein